MLDLKKPANQQMAMEAFFFGYQAFTAKADEMLALRGFSRVHQRIVFFIARYPGLSVKELLTVLGVSKQALNAPLRQLIAMNLVNQRSHPRPTSASRYRDGARFEEALRREQVKLLQRVFGEAGQDAVDGWLTVNRALGQTLQSGACPPAPSEQAFCNCAGICSYRCIVESRTHPFRLGVLCYLPAARIALHEPDPEGAAAPAGRLIAVRRGRRHHGDDDGLHQFAGADLPGRTGGAARAACRVSSWLWSLFAGMAVCSIGLSLRYRTPITVAWSTPGAALLITSLGGVSYPQAVGAFITSAFLVVLCGVTGTFERLVRRLPASLAAACWQAFCSGQ